MTVNVSKPVVNVREKLAELDKPTGIAGEAMLRAETPQEQFNLIGAGRRNLIINGKNTVNQRGLTPVTGMVNNTYYVDRWRSAVATVSANLSLDSSDMPSGFFGGSRQTITATSSATGYMGVIQKHENHTDFEGQTLTYSGWVKSNHPHAELRIYWASGKTATVKHSGSGEWEYLSVTFTVSSTPTSFETQVIVFDEASVPITSGDYISFTGVQLELGKVATPFEHRSYGEELALCQRYYYQPYETEGDDTAIMQATTKTTSQIIGVTHFPVAMRDAPSVINSSAQFRIDSLSKLASNTAGSTILIEVAGSSSAFLKISGFGGLVADNSFACKYIAGTFAFNSEL